MALFKLRKKVDEPVAAAAPAESMEAMRRRARHRLIGAVVLVLLGVVGFPLLFDTQPRPVPVDIPIEIPDRNKVAPLAPLSQAPSAEGKLAQAPLAAPLPAPPPADAKGEVQAKAEPMPPTPAPPAPVAQAESKPAPETLARTEAAPAPRTESKSESRPEPKPEPKPEAKADAPATDGAKARALLEGRTVAAAEAGRRYVVQVGAFAEKSSARQAQQKLERAGLKNYTNVTETRNGPRIRVRAGPFGSRAEADSAAEKIKGLDLPAAILSL